MDVLRCVKCKRTYYTPNAPALLKGDPRCSHCRGVLMFERTVSDVHVPEEIDDSDS